MMALVCWWWNLIRMAAHTPRLRQALPSLEAIVALAAASCRFCIVLPLPNTVWFILSCSFLSISSASAFIPARFRAYMKATTEAIVQTAQPQLHTAHPNPLTPLSFGILISIIRPAPGTEAVFVRRTGQDLRI
jgi:hypothetical protein